MTPPLRRIGISRLQRQLLLMARTLAQHAVEAQADEKGNQAKDDDREQ